MNYFLIGFLLFAISCNNHKDSSALPGKYIAAYEHEFGKTDDTLTLTKANDGANLYKIARHSGLIKILDGKTFPKEFLTELWILEYDEDKRTLTDLKMGKTLVWDSNRLTLQLGGRVYRKIGE